MLGIKILLNGARCLKCSDTVYSRDVHDFRYCSCKAIAVDGGTDYIRRLGAKEDIEAADAFDSKGDKGGECAGMFLIYSPGGKTNPATVFCRREDALRTANDMKKMYGGAWYISGPLEEVNG